MSFSPSIAVGQVGTNPALVVITDNSSGSDVLIISRKITFTNSAGGNPVPSGTTTSFVAWPLATNPISVNLGASNLDAALSIRVDWLNAAGTSIYDFTQEYPLERYNKNFFVYLLQQQALNPSIVQDTNYYSNLSQYYINIIGGIAMVEDADDIAGSQNCINRATYMMQNQSKFF